MLEIKQEHVEQAQKAMGKTTSVLTVLAPIFIQNSSAMATKMPAFWETYRRLKRSSDKAIKDNSHKAMALAVLPIYFANGEKLPKIEDETFSELPRLVKTWNEPERYILEQMCSFGKFYADVFEGMKGLIDLGFYHDLLLIAHALLRKIEIAEQQTTKVYKFHRAR